jgi:FkbM family methyltransferase
MLFSLPELIERYKMNITGVVHAGAHYGEEAEAYEACGIERVLWIEADPRLMAVLNERVYPLGQVTVCACVGARDGDEVVFHRADSIEGGNWGLSSSVLPLGTCRQVHPEIRYIDEEPMRTQTLATLLGPNWPWPGAPDFLTLDLQGYELECLKGAVPVLDSFRWVLTEINEDPLYEGCALLPELSHWMAERGFRLTEKKLWGAQARTSSSERWFGWGDALFVRA